MKRRGFTMYELAVSIALTSVITAAGGAFYLELRTSAVRSDANVVLVREASLAVEMMSRDLRNAKSATQETNAFAVDAGEAKPIRFVVEKKVLFRDGADGRTPIARFVRELRVSDVPGGYRLQVDMERELAEGRQVRIVREAFVGARRR